MHTDMDDEEDISEDLICPICLHLPEEEIFQCNNGHSICAECSKNTEDCPQCRVSYDEGKIRNRAMEAFIGSIKCSCPYKALGCTQTLRRRDLSSHKQTCIHNGKSIQICKVLGFRNCDVWTSALKIDSAISHFVETHGFILRKGCRGDVNLEHFVSSTLSKNGGNRLKDCLWTPVLVEYQYKTCVYRDDDADSDNSVSWSTDSDSEEEAPLEVTVTQNFIVLSRFHREDKTMSWLCVLLGDGTGTEASAEFEACFEIKTTSDKTPDLKWRMPCIELLHGEIMTHEMSPFRVPISLLHKYYLQSQRDDKLMVKFQIVKAGTTTETGIDETDDEEVETIWTFHIPLQNGFETEEKPCNECLGTKSEILFQCVTCTEPIFICGQCIETCAHPAQHELRVISGLDSCGDGEQACAAGSSNNGPLEDSPTSGEKKGADDSDLYCSLEELSLLEAQLT